MAAMAITSFLLSASAILLTPGPTNTLLAAHGASAGIRRAVTLPLAEAAGYALAISLFLSVNDVLKDLPAALSMLKIAAAVWLLASAARLWGMPVVPTMSSRSGTFGRVLVTTMLNPKAMLVGTLVIPGLMPGHEATAVVAFILLSTLAGMAWVVFGALLPARIRRHSYKVAAMILAGFAFFASASALQA